MISTTYRDARETPEHIAQLAHAIFGEHWEKHGVTYTVYEDGSVWLRSAGPRLSVRTRIGSGRGDVNWYSSARQAIVRFATRPPDIFARMREAVETSAMIAWITRSITIPSGSTTADSPTTEACRSPNLYDSAARP